MSFLGFPDGTSGKEPTCQCRRQKRCKFNSWVWTMPWRRAWPPTQGFLPGESHKGVWQATVHKVAESQTQLSDWHFHFHELLMITKMDMGLNTVTPAQKEHFQNQGMDIRVLQTHDPCRIKGSEPLHYLNSQKALELRRARKIPCLPFALCELGQGPQVPIISQDDTNISNSSISSLPWEIITTTLLLTLSAIYTITYTQYDLH